MGPSIISGESTCRTGLLVTKPSSYSELSAGETFLTREISIQRVKIRLCESEGKRCFIANVQLEEGVWEFIWE